MEQEKVKMRDMMAASYDDNKLDKSKELNDTMSIGNNGADEYEQKIFNVGGGE